MNRAPVKSKGIRAIGYDAATQKLEVEFANGRVYEYFDVPPEVHKTLTTADSISTAFNQCIREIYEYRRAPEPDEGEPTE